MKNVYAAFIKFQAELKPIKEEGWNPHFKSTFADLSSVLKAVTPVLTKHDLGVFQTCRVQDTGTILQTKVVHSSGEEIVSEMILPFLPDPQKFGALLTYYKRYQLIASLGVATKEDDTDGAGLENEFNGPTPDDFEYLREGIVKAQMTNSGVLKAVIAAKKREITALSQMNKSEYEYALKIVGNAIENLNKAKK